MAAITNQFDILETNLDQVKIELIRNSVIIEEQGKVLNQIIIKSVNNFSEKCLVLIMKARSNNKWL